MQSVANCWREDTFFFSHSQNLSTHFSAWLPNNTAAWSYEYFLSSDGLSSALFFQHGFGLKCLGINLCLSCVHPTHTWSINGVGSSRSISFCRFLHMGPMSFFCPTILKSWKSSDKNSPSFLCAWRHPHVGIPISFQRALPQLFFPTEGRLIGDLNSFFQKNHRIVNLIPTFRVLSWRHPDPYLWTFFFWQS